MARMETISGRTAEQRHSGKPERVHLAFQHTPRQERVHYDNPEWALGTLGYVPPPRTDNDDPTKTPPLVDDLFRAPEYDARGRRNWSRMVAVAFVGKARSQGIPYNDALLDMAHEVAQEAGLLLQRGYAPSSARWMATRERLVVGFERTTQAGILLTDKQIAALPTHRVDKQGWVHNDRRTATERRAKAERAGRNTTGAYIRRMPLEDQLEDRFRLEAVLHGREVTALLDTTLDAPHNTKQGKVLRKRFIRTVFGDRARSAKERYSAKAMMRSVKQLLHSRDKADVVADIDRRYLGVFGKKPARLTIPRTKCPAGMPTTPAETTEALVTYKDGDHSVVVFKPLRGGLSTVERFDQHAKDRAGSIALPERATILQMYQHYTDGVQYKDRIPQPEKAGPVFNADTGEAIPTGPVYMSFGDRMASKPGRFAIRTLITAPKARRKARAAYPVEPETAEQRFATVEQEVYQLTGITGWDY